MGTLRKAVGKKTSALKPPVSSLRTSTKSPANDKSGESTQPFQYHNSSFAFKHIPFMMATLQQENKNINANFTTCPMSFSWRLLHFCVCQMSMAIYQIIFTGLEASSQDHCGATPFNRCGHMYNPSHLNGSSKILASRPGQVSLMADLTPSSTFSLSWRIISPGIFQA